MKRALKFLHELGGIGVMGALVAYMLLIALAPGDSPEALAAVRSGSNVIAR